MEFALRRIPNDYKLKKAFLDKHSNSMEILCLGSSHAYYGINPVYFSKNSFNGSHISQSLDYDLKILKKYHNRLNNLKYILIPLSCFTLYYNLEDGIQSWRVKNYSLYYDIHTPKSVNVKAYSEVLSINFYLNLTRLYAYYMRKKPEITCSELGFGMNFSSNDRQDLIKTGITAAKNHGKRTIPLFNMGVDVLEQIIDFAQKNKSMVILFTPPAYYTYRENLAPDQLDDTLNAVREISKKHGNVIYKNYMYDKTFVESDFYDADHLNEIGAKKMTKILDNLILDIEKRGL
jgi:hypothetical protein